MSEANDSEEWRTFADDQVIPPSQHEGHALIVGLSEDDLVGILDNVASMTPEDERVTDRTDTDTEDPHQVPIDDPLTNGKLRQLLARAVIDGARVEDGTATLRLHTDAVVGVDWYETDIQADADTHRVDAVTVTAYRE